MSKYDKKKSREILNKNQHIEVTSVEVVRLVKLVTDNWIADATDDVLKIYPKYQRMYNTIQDEHACDAAALGKTKRVSAPTAIVTSPAGTFAGNTSIEGIDQFLGIPYTAPPVGDLRFANPQPYNKSLSNLFNATTYGPGCIQDKSLAEYNGLSEDCLTINLVRPRQSSDSTSSKVPVLFWIHGGGNVKGQSIYYNGTTLVQYAISIGQPIVYVSINYRLGGFGFMNAPEFQDQGLSNLGLKDQYLALQWINDNIDFFGGNASQVTIFGESAGAWNY